MTDECSYGMPCWLTSLRVYLLNQILMWGDTLLYRIQICSSLSGSWCSCTKPSAWPISCRYKPFCEKKHIEEIFEMMISCGYKSFCVKIKTVFHYVSVFERFSCLPLHSCITGHIFFILFYIWKWIFATKLQSIYHVLRQKVISKYIFFMLSEKFCIGYKS